MMSMFDILRTQHSIKESEFSSELTISSKMSCYIPKWEFCAGNVFTEPTGTSPSYYKIATSNEFVTYKDGEISSDNSTVIQLEDITDMPEDCFWTLCGDCYLPDNTLVPNCTFSNKVLVDYKNKKVTYIKEVFCLKITGEETWINWNYSGDSSSAHIYCTFTDEAPFYTSGPFQSDLRCSHYPWMTFDGSGNFKSNTWETWGPGQWHFYAMEGFDSLEDWIAFLKAESQAGHPLTIYTPRDLPDYSDFVREKTDITNTALGQRLLSITDPFLQGIGEMKYISSCNLNTTNNPLLKLYYVDHT